MHTYMHAKDLALSNKNINGLIFHFIEVDHPPKKINRWKLNI